MRLRNIPRADQVLSACPLDIKPSASICGTWHNRIFCNSHPIHLELGMGKGQFLLRLAALNPDINYLGVERYSSVLLRAVEKLPPGSSDTCPENIRFVCADARELESCLSPGEISCIYLNFSDPWPKARHAQRRLTSPSFLSIYRKWLDSSGHIEFKTDNRVLFDFSVSSIVDSTDWSLDLCTYDLHKEPLLCRGNIMTEYEERFSSKGFPICKLVASPVSPHIL